MSIVAKSYDPKRKVYTPCILPDGCVVVSDNLDDVVICAQCNKAIEYGSSYCSMYIHTADGLGFGYCVCESCHNIEAKKT